MRFILLTSAISHLRDITSILLFSYNVSFVGMVLPGDELSVKLTHTGMRDGFKIIKVETFNQRGEKVIDGSAEVAQPATTYVFTGQGSQEQGMGMELYSNSPTAKAVWDAADAHLGAVYGFSIIDIVKNNPKEKTVHFGGLKGQAIRQRYMDMTYDTTDKDGNVKTLPLFADIVSLCPSIPLNPQATDLFLFCILLSRVFERPITPLPLRLVSSLQLSSLRLLLWSLKRPPSRT